MQELKGLGYSALWLEAVKIVRQDCGPLLARRADPGYYSRRILVATAVADPATRVAALEALGAPLGIADRLVQAAGVRLVGAVRLWRRLPLPLNTVDGWVVLVRAQRAYVEAIDADDVDAEQRHRQEEGTPPETTASCLAGFPPELAARILEFLQRGTRPSAVAEVSPRALSPEEAAHYSGMRPETIEHLIKTRKIPYVQIGEQRGRAILIEDLDAFLREHRQPTGGEPERKEKRRGKRKSG